MGSSPHTRGLLSYRRPSSGSSGIIPAHAGFTAASIKVNVKLADHPRTRGVYKKVHEWASTPRGSSPHTRGLQAAGTDSSGGDGIIPAHAGFTPPRRTHRPCPGDHPRTRGVYAIWHCRSHPHRGSSPHTRGLRTSSAGGGWAARIIPAHAGFTEAHLDAKLRGSGSSPHTRGLLVHDLCRHVGWGIIPAHAGFTTVVTISPCCGTDHPRTRGVYCVERAIKRGEEGSSPHTRGLLWGGRASCAGERIIPAHAGFTGA